MLNKAVSAGRIGYHPWCREVNLSHLSFADDIVVFNDGSPASLEGTLKVFDDFALTSGLTVNIAKSTVFAAGRGKRSSEAVATRMGLSVSALPIKYLGLPLTTKIMSWSDYEPLLMRIRDRFLSWTSSALAYAGRLLLIKSVIASITNIWCAAFCLLQGCIDEIESMCSAFLWSGSPNVTSKVKLKVDMALVSELELLMGRLGEAVSPQTSIFLGCAGHNCGLMGVVEVAQTETASEKFLRMEIRNGWRVKFWFDLWHPLGRMIDITGEVGIQKLGIRRNATICDVLRGNEWQFRYCRDPGIRLLGDQIRAFPVVLDPDAEDAVLWKKDVNVFQGVFEAHSTWNLIRVHKVVLSWSRIIWFPQNVPRFAFVAWLAIKDRLATGHRMSNWSQGLACGCVFCGEPDETRDHLFFACPYTFTLWIDVAGLLLGTPPDPDWYITMEQIAHHSHDKLTTILLRLAYQVTIYYIWREWNDRKHNNTVRSVQQLARIVDKTIRSRIMSTRYFEKPKLRELLQRWFTTRISTA
ncbi:uncharacterized protein LOC125584381 [Brassica napus]|uniref:uncharacterized protein LOC125584381 n=1 Tax=Brassica napus TaxID=3708 RepID=UPI0020785DEB|nr:uncharacterized protein LOC125584381 [Brassica napus]